MVMVTILVMWPKLFEKKKKTYIPTSQNIF